MTIAPTGWISSPWTDWERAWTGYLRSRGVGIMCADKGVMLRLYVDGRLRDAYISSPGGFGQRRCYWWFFCHGHALRWRDQLTPGYSVKELADAFARGEQGGRAVFSEMRLMLGLDEAGGFRLLLSGGGRHAGNDHPVFPRLQPGPAGSGGEIRPGGAGAPSPPSAPSSAGPRPRPK